MSLFLSPNALEKLIMTNPLCCQIGKELESTHTCNSLTGAYTHSPLPRPLPALPSSIRLTMLSGFNKGCLWPLLPFLFRCLRPLRDWVRRKPVAPSPRPPAPPSPKRVRPSMSSSSSQPSLVVLGFRKLSDPEPPNRKWPGCRRSHSFV